MSPRKEIEREQFATSIKLGLKDKLKQLSDQTRIPQSKLMDEAIEDLLAKHCFEEEKNEKK